MRAPVRTDAAARLVVREVIAHEVLAREASARAAVGRAALRADPRDAGPTASARAGRTGRRVLPPADLALGLRALATLLEADLPMGRTLAAFADLAPPAWRSALPAITSAVRDGRSLSAAFAEAPVRIPAVVTGLVRAGEAGGGLADAVRQAAELTERAARTRAAVRAALAYPALLTVAGTASVVLLVTVVLPRFALILADLGQTLPWSTRAVLAASTLAQRAAPGVAMMAVGLAVLWRLWVATPEGLRRWHGLLLRVPLLGTTRWAAASARSAAALAALLDRGVSAAPALAHAARAAGDTAVEARLVAARTGVIAGESVAAALGRTRALTATTIRLARAGEVAGRLAPMLAHASRIEAERAESVVTQAVRLLEPVLILGFGAGVALVAAALLQAVYSIRPGA